MLILHVAAPSDVGGLERVVQGLAREQRRAGHDVHVAAILTGPAVDHPFFTPLADAGVETHIVLPGPRGYRRERGAVAELCRRLRPTVVHAHGYRPDVLDAGVARRAGVPVVTTVHGFTGGDWKNRVYEWLQCRAFRRFDAVVVVSQPLKTRLVRAGVHAERIHVVPNAWRPGPALDRAAARRALGLGPEAFVVGWVGRLSREKGLDVLLDAIGHVADLPLVASVIGDGAERRPLAAQARRLGLDGRVRWHGVVPDAAPLFAAFDLFVLSSRTEGSPMGVFDAMAAAHRRRRRPPRTGRSSASCFPPTTRRLRSRILSSVFSPSTIRRSGARSSSCRMRRRMRRTISSPAMPLAVWSCCGCHVALAR